MNKWNDIVLVLKNCQSGNVLEKDYQQEIENQFKLLGWSVYYGCIESKPQLETANTNIYPDIVLKKDGVRVLPIELKRPTNNLKKKNERQLFSYMRQLEIRVGLYIGEKLQLYYNAPDDTDAPHAILTTDFQPDSHEGAILCDLLSFDHFDIKQLEIFCAERLEKKRYREQLKKEFDKTFSEENGTIFLKKLVKDHFIEGCKDDAILDEEISKIELYGLYGNHKRTSKSAKKESKRLKKYSLNGSRPMFMRTLVLEAVGLYIEKNPRATYNEIEKIFNVKEMPGGYKVVRRLSEIQENIEAGSLTGRFFTAKSQILTSGDGIEFAVSNQWEYHNFPVFISILKKLKWKVKEI